MLFSSVAFAKPVHTKLLNDGYTDDTAMNFVLLINKGIDNLDINLPYMTNFNLIDDGTDGMNAYLGSWGSSTVILKKDVLTNEITYISISLPSAFYTEDITVEERNYFGELGLIFGVINKSNEDISEAEIDAARSNLLNSFNGKTSCSCSAGKLHYEWVYNDNIMVMSFSAIVDDGTK